MVRPTLVKSEGGRTNFRRWARESRDSLVEAVFGSSSCRDVGSERENEGTGKMAVTRIAVTNGGGKENTVRLNVHLCYSILCFRNAGVWLYRNEKRIQWEGREE